MKTPFSIFLLLCALLFGGAPAAHAAAVSADYSAASDVPVTANGYTATGNTVGFTLNFAPVAGTELMVVNNTGLDFIGGAFSNLAHGQIVPLTFNGVTYRFVANYYGGSGNDLVLAWADNRLVGWGYNLYAQVGDSSTLNRSTPTPVYLWDLTGKTVIALATGARHSLALCSDGTVAAWGNNDNGQLGDGSTLQRTVPVLVNTQSGLSALSGKKVVAIAAGAYYSLALCSDGTVAAWGSINLGLGYDRYPMAVSMGGRKAVGISAGETHSLARCSDGTVLAWGAGGLIGDSTSTPRTAPTAVNTASGISALFGKSVSGISAGRYHSLALCTDGTVVAWGQNGSGQLGDTTIISRNAPVAVNGASGVSALFGKTVVAVAAGENFSTALCADGTMAAWGSDTYGELGDGGGPARFVPVAVDMTSAGSALAGKTVTSIAAGRNHVLVRCSDNSAAAWGQNTYGQLGDSSVLNRALPVAVSASALAGGERDLRVFSNSTASHSVGLEVIPVSPVVITLPAQAAKTSATLAGTVDARGLSTDVFFEYGADTQYGTTVAANPTPLTGSAATAVSAPLSGLAPGSTYHYRAGASSIAGTKYGVDLTFTTSADLAASWSAPDDVPATAPVWNVAGATVNLALNFAPATGTDLMVLKHTGLGFINGAFANLAQGDVVTLSYQGATFTFVANYYGGTGNDLVLTWASQEVFAWGANSGGQLGDGTTNQRNLPVPVNTVSLLSGKTVLSMASGNAHTLALLSNGTVASWGDNANGQLGDGTFTRRLTPVLVNTASGSALAGKRVIAIAAGQTHSLALCSDGTLAAWGYNSSGQLGDGTNTQSTIPVAVSTNISSPLAGRTPVAIAAGFAHSLALCSDGTILAWGYGGTGGLGNNGTLSSTWPVVTDLTALSGRTPIAVSAGNYHSLALCTDGTVFGWGTNSDGQLGDKSFGQRLGPVPVYAADASSALFGRSVVAIAAGGIHSVALCSDGAVVGWGNDGSGRLGDNSTSTQNIPVLANTANGVSALYGKTVVSIAAGQVHTLAQCADGTATAWGFGAYGQLGDNTATNRLVPTNVSTTTLAAGERFAHLYAGPNAFNTMGVAAVAAQAPLVSTNPLTAITSTGVTFHGSVRSNGAPTDVVFQYTTDPTFTSGVMATAPPQTVPFNATNYLAAATQGGLAAHTTYYYRIHATNSVGTADSPTLSFTTLNTAPTAPNQAMTGTTGDQQTVTVTFPALDADGDTVSITSATSSTLTVKGFTATTVTFLPASNATGARTITYIVSDGHGLTATGTLTVTVTDNDEPQTTLTSSPASPTKATTARFDFNGSDNLSVAGFQASLDNGAYTPAVSPLNLTGLAEGPHNLRVRALDSSGNADSSPAIAFWVVDLTPPAINSISGNLTVEADGPAGTVVDYAAAAAVDAVTAAPIITYSKATGTLFPVGSTTVVVTATDEVGNQSSGSFTVNVQDSTGPTVAPHANVTAEATSAAGAIVAYAPGTATDTVTGSPALSYSIPSGSLFPLGITTVTITATDGPGNTGTGSFTVTVVDHTPPVIAAHARVTADATNTAGAVVSFDSATATDLVDPAPLITYSKLSGTAFPIGATPVKIMATDAAGNTSTQTFVVTVNAAGVDKKAPVVAITSPKTGTVTGAFTLAGTVTENVMLKSFQVTRNGVPLALDAPLVFVPDQKLTWSVAGIVPENGTDTFVVEAVDFAGKVTTAKKSITFTNQRPELVGTYNALLVPAGPRTLETTGLVTVTVGATGAFSGKYFLSNATVPFKGVLRNDGTASFLPALTPQLDLVDKVDGYLGALGFSVGTPTGMTGTLATQAGGSSLATFAAQPIVHTSSPVPAALLNFPTHAAVPTKGVYTIVFPTGVSNDAAAPTTWPQGDGYATLTVMKTGSVALSGFLADGTRYVASAMMRTDGSVPLFTPLYLKRGVFSGELAFAYFPDSDISGAGFAWYRPAATTGNTFRAGWPAGLTLSPVGAKYAPPAAFDFGQGIPDVVSGNASLVFSEGLMGGTRTSPVSVAPATGAVKLIRPATTPGTLTLAPATGLFSGAFTHGSVTDKFSGILLHKGANQGGFGYFLTTPLIFGAGVQSGGASLQPRVGD